MPDIRSLQIKRILIIDLAFIGDVILAGPLTEVIRSQWPKAEITMLTVPLTAPVAEMLPAIDRTIVYDKKGQHRGLGGMWQMSKVLRQEHFDLAICMNFALRGAALARLAGIPYRLGYAAQHGSWFLTWAASPIREGIKHETENHLEVLKPWRLPHVTAGSLRLVPGKAAIDSFQVKKQKLSLADKGQYFVLCPIGSYERKNMPMPLAVELITRLEAQKPVYLIGGNKEAADLQAMAERANIGKARVLAGSLNLTELAVFLQEAAAMVSVDTGPMHIAQAVQCPTVALFGPTDPVVWGPKNGNSRTIYHSEPCSPCWGKGECSSYRCVDKIKAEEVFAALKQIM